MRYIGNGRCEGFFLVMELRGGGGIYGERRRGREKEEKGNKRDKGMRERKRRGERERKRDERVRNERRGRRGIVLWRIKHLWRSFTYPSIHLSIYLPTYLPLYLPIYLDKVR